jgi:glycopeptide antibiotics resistance protein
VAVRLGLAVRLEPAPLRKNVINNHMQRIIQWTCILYVIVLTLLLELPSGVREIVPGISLVQGCEHLVAFTLLGFLVELSREKKSVLFWVNLLFLYSFTTEVLQWLLSSICYRCFDWDDLLLDVGGVLLGTVIGHWCRPFVQRRMFT